MTSAVTTIPKVPEATQQPQTILFSVTAETVKRFEGYRDLKVTDFRDKSQLAAVHAARMELVKARTTVDKIRKEMNEDHNREIKLNNEKAKGLLSLFEPIESHLKSEEERAEAAIEAERIAANNKLLNDRKSALAKAVGEFTDMLAPYPDYYIANVPESAFRPLLESLPVQVAVRRAAAEQARLAKELADKALAEQQERDRLAEVERVRQQAIEDANRKAAQAELDAKMAAFEKQQAEAAELQRKADADREARIAQENADRLEREAAQRAEAQAKLDAQNAELERQRAEIETKRLAYEAEMLRLAKEAERAEAARLADEAHEINQQAIRDADARAAEMRPDIEKMCSWITAIENHADEQFPSVSPKCEDLLTELHRDLSGCIDAMRGRLM